MTIADFGDPASALWFTCSSPSGISDLSRFSLSCLGPLVFFLPYLVYSVEVLWFSSSQILSILLRSFGFLTPRFCLSCLDPLILAILFKTLWFSCSQVLVILFRPIGFLAPRFCLSCLDPYFFVASRFCLSCLGPLVFLLPDFGYPA